jgi:hypothetical protein
MAALDFAMPFTFSKWIEIGFHSLCCKSEVNQPSIARPVLLNSDHSRQRHPTVRVAHVNVRIVLQPRQTTVNVFDREPLSQFHQNYAAVRSRPRISAVQQRQNLAIDTPAFLLRLTWLTWLTWLHCFRGISRTMNRHSLPDVLDRRIDRAWRQSVDRVEVDVQGLHEMERNLIEIIDFADTKRCDPSFCNHNSPNDVSVRPQLQRWLRARNVLREVFNFNPPCPVVDCVHP